MQWFSIDLDMESSDLDAMDIENWKQSDCGTKWLRGRWEVAYDDEVYRLSHEDLLIGGNREQWVFTTESSLEESTPGSIRAIVADFCVSRLFGLIEEGHKTP